MSADLDERRRRALYRAQHRGTKEMDWLLGRYAEAKLAGMSDTDLIEFEQLMALPDPELQGWLLGLEMPIINQMSGLVGAIRQFHGLAV